MSDWPYQPRIVEINRWTWVRGLTLRYGRKMGLESDFSPQDVSGSPYSIAQYCADSELGGAEGLAQARQQLARPA